MDIIIYSYHYLDAELAYVLPSIGDLRQWQSDEICTSKIYFKYCLASTVFYTQPLSP